MPPKMRPLRTAKSNIRLMSAAREGDSCGADYEKPELRARIAIAQSNLHPSNYKDHLNLSAVEIIALIPFERGDEEAVNVVAMRPRSRRARRQQ